MCEVCGTLPAREGDKLCPYCDHYYTILLDLLGDDPEAFDRLRRIFEWRMKKLQTIDYV